MANTLPTLNDSPLLPSPAASLRGLELSSTPQLSGQLARNEAERGGLQYTSKGLEDVADALDAVQVEDDKRNAKDNLTGYSKELRTVLYGDGTKDNPGYYNLMGDDAVNQRGAYQGKITALQKKYKDQTANTQSARLFTDAASAVTAPELDNIAQHSAKQKLVAFQASSAAASDEAASRFMANPTNETVRAQSAVVVTNEALSQADMAGIKDPVARANAVRTSLSKMYSGAVLTELQRDVDAGRHLYEKFQGTIDGDDQAKLENAIHTEQRAKDQEIEHQAVMQRLAVEQADKKAFTGYISLLVGGKDIDMKAVAADPNMDGSSKITIFNFAKAIDSADGPSAKTSRINTADAFGRINLPDGDPNKITNEKQISQLVIDGKVGKDDWGWLNQRLQENQSSTGQRINTQIEELGKAVKPQLVYMNGITGQTSGMGAEQFGQWQHYAYDKIQEYKDNNKNPNDLFNPASKDYIASPGVLKNFTVSFKDQMAHITDNLSGTGTPKTQINPSLYKTPEDVLGGYANGSLASNAVQNYFEGQDVSQVFKTESDMLEAFHHGAINEATARSWYNSQSAGGPSKHKATKPQPLPPINAPTGN